MNAYAELLDLLTPKRGGEPGAVLGQVSGLSPLTVTVGETTIQTGLLRPAGLTLHPEDRVALLPCGAGLLILCLVEEEGT